MKRGKYPYFKIFSAIVFVLWGINLLVAYKLKVDSDKVSLMIAFLWVLFLSFSIFYRKIKDKGDKFILWYLGLMGLKFVLAIAGAFLFLKTGSEQVKQEALFYLFDYFILLMFDSFLKVKR